MLQEVRLSEQLNRNHKAERSTQSSANQVHFLAGSPGHLSVVTVMGNVCVGLIAETALGLGMLPLADLRRVSLTETSG